jgi:hypothetical protein
MNIDLIKKQIDNIDVLFTDIFDTVIYRTNYPDYNKMPRNRRLGYLWIDNKPAAVIKRAQIWLKKKLSSKQIY